MPEGQNIEQIPINPEVSKTPENINSPEKSPEQLKNPEPVQAKEMARSQIQAKSASATQPQSQQNDTEIILHKVEEILSQGMEQIYLSMDAAAQATFKAKGEETSQKIASLMSKTKVQLKQVIGLIVEWLRVVPTINKYFIEQEAKIKADAIMDIYNRRK